MTIKAWQGPSTIDGKNIMAVVSCHDRASNNIKTGDMVQVSFMRTDMKPGAAVKEGKDYSVCGSCPLRPRARESSKALVCYVATHWKAATWKAAKAMSEDIKAAAKAMKYKAVRFGEYGNMSSIPREAAEKLLRAAPKWTLYEHEWRKPSNQWMKQWAMASVHSPEEFAEADAMGWRCFRTKKPSDPVLPGEVECPNSTHKVQCRDCLLCDGKRNNKDKRKSVCNNVH